MKTTSGWLYLATVIDCCCKKVCASHPASHEGLFGCPGPRDGIYQVRITPNETVFHSDLRSQYLSGKFQRALSRLNISQSVGRTGTALDNALAESFFGFFKTECLYRYPIADPHRTRAQVVSYIEDFYNTEGFILPSTIVAPIKCMRSTQGQRRWPKEESSDRFRHEGLSGFMVPSHFCMVVGDNDAIVAR